MRDLVQIEQVFIDANGVLMVRPLGKSYEFVYRDASGIRWFPNDTALGAYEPARWEHIGLFQQILCAVRSEYGDFLFISPSTNWSNVPSMLKTGMEAFSSKFIEIE